MSLVVQQSDIGESVREPFALPRRRLSIENALKRVQENPLQRRIPHRPYIVSVHRRADYNARSFAAFSLDDDTVIVRALWQRTTVGPDDVMVITYLPLGGGGGGGQGGGKQIGMALAGLLLSVVAPMAIGALGPAFGGAAGLTTLGKVLSAGLVAGVQYFMSAASKGKDKDERDDRPVYGVSGGGNLPRAGDRIPVHYGQCWVVPDLSQPDYFYYEATTSEGKPDSDQVLCKRMTIGLGVYEIETIRLGQSIVWQNGVKRRPFEEAEIEIINPGEKSTLVPSGVWSSGEVQGINVARRGDAIEWSGPFPCVPTGEDTKKIQIDFTLPQGLYETTSKKSGTRPAGCSIYVEIARMDPDDNPIPTWDGEAWHRVYTEDFQMKTTRAQRFTRFITKWPNGTPLADDRYLVRIQQNPKKYPDDDTDNKAYDQFVWEGLRGWLDKEPARPFVTEVAIKIRSSRETGNVGNFSDFMIEVTRKLRRWNGSTWLPIAKTRKAVWAALDIIRNQNFGYGAPDSQIDLERFRHYANTVTEYDNFDGTIRGPVAVAEAVGTVLGVIRAEPVIDAGIWTMTRDEPRSIRKHVITRRQIVRDSTGIDFDLDMSDGASDVIVEYFIDADPDRRSERRVTIGPETITPRRIQAFGIRDHKHAIHLAKWYAAAAYYRRQHRLFTTELAGRNLVRNDAALVDAWFLNDQIVAGVEDHDGLDFTLDCEIPALPPAAHAIFRNSEGMEWGPVAVTALTGADDGWYRVNSADATAVATYYGEFFSNLFVRDQRKLPVTVKFGTLQQMQEAYIIRTTRYDANGQIQISAINDAPEVWSVLGEEIPDGPPITQVIFNESNVAPILPYLRAQIVQKGAALVLEWMVGEARGAVAYQIAFRYADETDSTSVWESIHNGRAMEGSHVLEYREVGEVRVRAIAVNAKGMKSLPVYDVATLFKPYIDDETAEFLIRFENLTAQLQKDLEMMSQIGEATLRDAIKGLNEKVEDIASSAATSQAQSYERRELIKLAVDDAYAAILRETQLRIDDDQALAEQIETMATRWKEDISAAAIQTEQRVMASAHEAIAENTLVLRAQWGNDISGAIAEEAKVRAGEDGVLASRVQIVESSANGNTFRVDQITQSLNGNGGFWGINLVADGRVAGGLRLEGFRNADGTVKAQFGISADVLISGTLEARHLAAQTLYISTTAQIGQGIIKNANIDNLTVDTIKLKHGSITTSYSGQASAGAELNLDVFCRTDSRLHFFVRINPVDLGNANVTNQPPIPLPVYRLRVGSTTIRTITPILRTTPDTFTQNDGSQVTTYRYRTEPLETWFVYTPDFVGSHLFELQQITGGAPDALKSILCLECAR